VAFVAEPEAAYAPIEPERIDIPPVVEPVAAEPVLEAPHVPEVKHDEGAALLEEFTLSPEVLAQLQQQEMHAAEAEHADHAGHADHVEHIELPPLDLEIPEELSTPAALPVAEVLDFPGMTKPAAAQDDSVKRIGDLEISLPLHNIYLAETDELVRRLSQDIAEWRHEPERHVNVLAVHAAHSLSGSSATVGFTPLQEIAHALEMVLQFLARKPVRLIDSEYDTLEHGIERIRFMLQMFALGEMPDHEPEQVQILERMQSEIEARLHMTPELAPLPHGFAEHRHEVVVEPEKMAAAPAIEDFAHAEHIEHVEPAAIEHIELPEPVHHVEPVAELPHAEESFAAEHVAIEHAAAEHPETPALIEPISLHAAPTAEAIDAVAADLGIPEIPAFEAHEAHDLPLADVHAVDGTLADQVAHLENLLGQTTPEVIELAALPAIEELPALEPVVEEPAPVAFEPVLEVPTTPEPVIDAAHAEHAPVAELPAIEEFHEPVTHESVVHHEPEVHHLPAVEVPAIEEIAAEPPALEPVAEAHVEQTHVEQPAIEEHVPVTLEGEPLAVAHIPHTPFAEPVIPQSEEAAVDPSVMLLLKDELDPDLLPVFLEEGRDMFPQLSEELRNWQNNPSDIRPQNASLRLLHTIKGSARMAGAMNLGQHMHELETRIEQITHSSSPSAAALDEIIGRFDHGQQMFDDLLNPEAKVAREAAAAAALAAAAEAAANAPVAAQSAEAATAAPEAARGMVELKSLVPTAPTTSVATPRPATPVKTAAPAAQASLVRVRADILDRLVNQAGEVSISRSKLETEVGTLRQSLTEMTENVTRLRDQLREIEMQAESQITSRMGHNVDREFDPLEFDRFTRLQELTRMMAESVNDVSTVQQNLSRTIDNANNDLLTQGRLTRDLQQDLMRVRMVQFASISERLYRVTRQASKELDKRVNLDIRGSAVEMDRGVLERMAGPFEHLLRNAIVHGIETRDRRVAAGKAEIGEMLVEIRQEGNEVVIQFSDDGQGLNLERIRSKALSVGLIGVSDELSEAEVTDLIFNPGFSTAEQVTELAGRGVGMDVVRSEAAALGGRVSVVSELGKGAHFTIHLPLTLAVTQVVILTTGGKTYAVPSVLVEQVQQLKTGQLTNAYNDGAVMWQGQRVPLHYLAALLGDRDATPIAQQYSPIIILKSGNDRLAVHVDEIQGNREVVVKNIGPQLARMIGIAGATVLGSGEIVLILNPVPLSLRFAHENIRAPRLTPATDVPENMGAVATLVQTTPATPTTEPVQGLRTQHIVMVVDDSLTVRRVTQRLLAREGYQVVLAKDGVDALEHLQSINPDVMLVDIEMPRMDGFDLTRNVRNDERTRHIPIIMITSRTASKHRNYAMELGVNEYLGKPYQEDALLKSIAGFVSKEIPVA
jgi:chemosensory pili system protein ChpA (sensor histidine kinase/response regulator)